MSELMNAVQTKMDLELNRVKIIKVPEQKMIDYLLKEAEKNEALAKGILCEDKNIEACVVYTQEIVEEYIKNRPGIKPPEDKKSGVVCVPVVIDDDDIHRLCLEYYTTPEAELKRRKEEKEQARKAKEEKERKERLAKSKAEAEKKKAEQDAKKKGKAAGQLTLPDLSPKKDKDAKKASTPTDTTGVQPPAIAQTGVKTPDAASGEKKDSPSLMLPDLGSPKEDGGNGGTEKATDAVAPVPEEPAAGNGNEEITVLEPQKVSIHSNDSAAMDEGSNENGDGNANADETPAPVAEAPAKVGGIDEEKGSGLTLPDPGGSGERTSIDSNGEGTSSTANTDEAPAPDAEATEPPAPIDGAEQKEEGNGLVLPELSVTTEGTSGDKPKESPAQLSLLDLEVG